MPDTNSTAARWAGGVLVLALAAGAIGWGLR